MNQKTFNCIVCGKEATRSKKAKYCSYECSRDNWREYRKQHSKEYRKTEAGKAVAKKYYERNKDELNRKRQQYRDEHREENRETQRIWREKNRERLNRKSREYHKRKRAENKQLVFAYYGNKCACCGESNSVFLTVDHIEGGGTAHKKVTNNNLHSWLVRNDYPEGFQILCWNCNCGRARTVDKICPHQQHD